VVCVECVERGPLYSALRSVPAKVIHGNTKNHLQEDQDRLPAKMHLDRCLSRFGQTMGSAGPTLPPLATAFLWYTAWWVLMSDGRCWGLVGRFGLVCGPPLLMLRRMPSFVSSVCVFVMFSSYSGLVLLKS